MRLTTGVGSSADGMSSGGSVAIVVYGNDGKTGKITLQPTTDGIQQLLPGETDSFKVRKKLCRQKSQIRLITACYII